MSNSDYESLGEMAAHADEEGGIENMFCYHGWGDNWTADDHGFPDDVDPKLIEQFFDSRDAFWEYIATVKPVEVAFDEAYRKWQDANG